MLVVPKILETIQHMFEFCVRCAKCAKHFFSYTCYIPFRGVYTQKHVEKILSPPFAKTHVLVEVGWELPNFHRRLYACLTAFFSMEKL